MNLFGSSTWTWKVDLEPNRFQLMPKKIRTRIERNYKKPNQKTLVQLGSQIYLIPRTLLIWRVFFEKMVYQADAPRGGNSRWVKVIATLLKELRFHVAPKAGGGRKGIRMVGCFWKTKKWTLLWCWFIFSGGVKIVTLLKELCFHVWRPTAQGCW